MAFLQCTSTMILKPTTKDLISADISSPATSSLMATYMYGTYVRKYIIPAQAAATLALE